jgi:hypothetical protein
MRRLRVQVLLGVALAGLMIAFAPGCSDELKVTDIEPPAGTFSGGEEVVIRGNGFQQGRGVMVKFGKRDALNIVVDSSSRIKVTTPSGDKNTIADVSVVFDDGKSFLLKNGFRYIDSTQNKAQMDKALNALGGGKPGAPGAPAPEAPAAAPASPAAAPAPAAAAPAAPTPAAPAAPAPAAPPAPPAPAPAAK